MRKRVLISLIVLLMLGTITLIVPQSVYAASCTIEYEKHLKVGEYTVLKIFYIDDSGESRNITKYLVV